MSIAEAKQEIKNHYEQAVAFERKHDGKLLAEWPNEDVEQYKAVLSTVDGLEAKLGALEEDAQYKGRTSRALAHLSTPAEPMVHPTGPAPAEVLGSFGQQFIGSATYEQHKAAGAFLSQHIHPEFAVVLQHRSATPLDAARLQRKALVYSATGSAGSMIFPDVQPGVQALPTYQTTLLDLVSRTNTTSDSIEYVQVASFTNNAATVAEASVTTGTTGTKAESALTTVLQTATVQTIAHWVPVTNKMLADAPAIRGIIDQHLMVGLEQVLEAQVLTGDGQGTNLTGILNAGIQSTGAAGNNTLDQILHARTLCRVNGYVNPDVVVMNPLDFEAIRYARESAASATLGGYLMGPPSMVGETTLWGMRVVEAAAMTENTALVGDFRLGGMLFLREEANIRTGTINDYFVRNMQVILAEMRAAWATFRPSAFCKCTGV